MNTTAQTAVVGAIAVAFAILGVALFTNETGALAYGFALGLGVAISRKWLERQRQAAADGVAE